MPIMVSQVVVTVIFLLIDFILQDGLEATRQMRQFEKEENLPPAFIVSPTSFFELWIMLNLKSKQIALSGLSDSEDGSHCSALASGQSE